MQERAIALTGSQKLERALVHKPRGVASAFSTAPPQAATSGTLGMPRPVHAPAALPAPAAFNLKDDWFAVEYDQIESCMAAAGALGVGAGGVHSTAAHDAQAAAAAGGAACDTQAVQTVALCRTEATAGESG
jgi:hypothetical protein